MEEVVNYNKETSQGCDSNSNGNNNNNKNTRSGSNYGAHGNIEPSICLKSNLKNTVVKENQIQSTKTEKRKVSWPDAHGKDIAHIQEFEPSVSEDGELEAVRNSCVCVIQ